MYFFYFYNQFFFYSTTNYNINMFDFVFMAPVGGRTKFKPYKFKPYDKERSAAVIPRGLVLLSYENIFCLKNYSTWIFSINKKSIDLYLYREVYNKEGRCIGRVEFFSSSWLFSISHYYDFYTCPKAIYIIEELSYREAVGTSPSITLKKYDSKPIKRRANRLRI